MKGAGVEEGEPENVHTGAVGNNKSLRNKNTDNKNIGNTPRRPSTGEWADKLRNSHAEE